MGTLQELPASAVDRPRRRNIVLCADGTCNAFGQSSSNVAKLIEYLDLSDEAMQVVAYDQGLGTRADQVAAIETFRKNLARPQALQPLPPPSESLWKPWSWGALLASMTKGSDLDRNVGQLYIKLAELYRPGDTVFLFGFSRGAFTVRALAGLTWRYGIPPTNERDVAKECFERAWPLFFAEFPDPTGSKRSIALEFQAKQQRCPIHFLGLWDTVKSYGGLKPVMLPHLRHNPSVQTVRHALALDERRAWFEPTTWGWLDSDRTSDAAASRLSAEDIALIQRQDVVEVWFTGCHSDVGGGGCDTNTSDIALRWMLGEAECAGLGLNENGQRCLSVSREVENPKVADSHSAIWRLIERVRRQSINNSGAWPVSVTVPLGAAAREPSKGKRDGKVWVHESVTDLSSFNRTPENITIETRRTRRF
jgi:uncharacterized protein (DUF2235 family)